MGRLLRTLSFLALASCVVVTFSSNVCFAISDCIYSGVNFSDGAVACQSGHQFRCSNGTWRSLDLPCVIPPPASIVIDPAACNCTVEEVKNCDRSAQACCVSLESGHCVKRCCERH